MFDLTQFLASADLNLFVVGVCAVGIGFALHDLVKAYACKHWPSTEGKIILSEPAYKPVGKWEANWPEMFYLANVKYIFSVNGREYTGSRIFLSKYRFANAIQVHDLLRKYSDGKNVTVYYNPNNPGDCILEINQLPQYFLWTCGTLAVCLFLLSLVYNN